MLQIVEAHHYLHRTQVQMIVDFDEVAVVGSRMPKEFGNPDVAAVAFTINCADVYCRHPCSLP